MNTKTLLTSIILLFLCLISSPIHAQSEADSLQALLNRLPANDTTRLVHLQRIAIIKQSTYPGLEAAQKLFKEAERLDNDKYKCYAFYYVSLYYFNNKKSYNMGYYARRAIELAEKEEMWYTYFEASKLVINSHILNHEYEYSIKEAMKMYDKAKLLDYPDGIILANFCLAKAYVGTNRMEDAIQLLKDTYEESVHSNNQLVTIEIVTMLATLAYYTSNYKDLFVYIQDLEKAIEKHLENHLFSESYYSIYLFRDIHYAYYYSATGKPKQALHYLEEADKYREKPMFMTYRSMLYDAYADYYRALKKYDKAISMVDSSMITLTSFMPKDYYRQVVKKANILSEVGEANDALILYQESLHGKDSIDRILSGKQMEQIQEIYNVKKLQIENEEIRTNQRLVILILMAILTVLLVVFIFRALSLRIKLKKSEHEMRKASRVAEQANEIKNQFLSNISFNIRTPLNSVMGFSELIALEPDMKEEQQKEYSTIVKKKTEVLLNLVNDVLDLSRLESGMMKFNLQEYGVITLCQEAIYTAKSKEQPVQIILHAEMEEQLINVDAFRFSQVLTSLLTSPTPSDKELIITLILKLDESKKFVLFQIIGSPIAEPELIAQEVTVRNDFNSLFLKHFGGTYKINPESSAGPEIVFTYPLSISE